MEFSSFVFDIAFFEGSGISYLGRCGSFGSVVGAFLYSITMRMAIVLVSDSGTITEFANSLSFDCNYMVTIL